MSVYFIYFLNFFVLCSCSKLQPIIWVDSSLSTDKKVVLLLATIMIDTLGVLIFAGNNFRRITFPLNV